MDIKKTQDMSKDNKFNYEEELAKLHTEFVHLQEWVKKQGLKVVIVFEGRDGCLEKAVLLNDLQNL